ncbi:CMP-N,N'-diacetyllegionaminic acid synthase [bioreactor metagenome]|uniref:CMP-N,N'-diacetyllegionaminic acid synthase n=1 Tax=bioreactor metagenome TaxID=1076179 RepID=A0A644TPH4_9ZZZZ
MIGGKSVLAIIPARGGSKGVPRKNIRDLAGKPLIAWTIDEAKKSKYIDRLILSSEDEEIINVVKRYGCEVPFVRPQELAADDTPGIEPVLHAMKMMPRYDYIVLLQVTSPMRTVEDIDGCIERCIEQQADSCVSVTEVEKSPYWMYKLDERGKMRPLLKKEDQYYRRQNLPKVYELNGAVYVSDSEYLEQEKSFVTEDTIGYEMSKKHSIDIDTEMDLRIVEMMKVSE